MSMVKELFEEYKQRAHLLLKDKHQDRNAGLVELENEIADASGLPEGDRLKLRAYMEEYRRQKINDFEAGAMNS